jgi:hypothetical protein
MAVIETLSGRPADALQGLDRFVESPVFMLDRATAIASPCLVLGDAECLAEQAARLEQVLAELAAKGSPVRSAERYTISIAILRNAAEEDIAKRDIPGLEAILEKTRNWPVVFKGGRGGQRTGYQRAMVQSLLGRDDDAVLELMKTLEFEDGGFLSSDFLGLPPDVNPVLVGLRGATGYADWYDEFSSRREKIRGTLIRMEERGEILSALDISQ